MDDAQRRLLGLIEQSLRIQWLAGAATEIGTHTTGWRTSPGVCIAEIHGLRTTVRLASGPPHVAHPGWATVIDEGTYQCLDSVELDHGLVRWGHAYFHILGGVSVLSLFEIPVVRPPPRATEIGRACVELAEAHRDADEAPVRSSTRRAALKLRLLEAIIDGEAPNERAVALLANAQRLAPALAWIDEHLAQPTSREALARIAGLSPSRFHELFLAVMRESPMAYLQRRRVQRAQQLLVGGGPSVGEVAAAVGFADPFHFSRVFKRVTGQSPNRYRAEMAQGLSLLGTPRGGNAP
jgi:AraC-like DNA-binding protein